MESIGKAEVKQAIGIDLSDKYSYVCVLDEMGEIKEESRLKKRSALLAKVLVNSSSLEFQ